MNILKALSEAIYSLFVLSVISYLIISILPDESSSKRYVKVISGFISITVMISITFIYVNSDKIDLSELFSDDFEINSELEDYIVNKMTDALAADIENSTKDIFDDYDIDDVEMIIFTDKSDGHNIVINKVVFEVYGESIDKADLTERIKQKIGVDCMVVIGESNG